MSGNLDGRIFALISPELERSGFDVESISYSVYHDDRISQVVGTSILVGFGRSRERGGHLGFLIEATDVGKVVDFVVLHPGAASYHKEDAREARRMGVTLQSRLVERSERLRKPAAPPPSQPSRAVPVSIIDAPEETDTAIIERNSNVIPPHRNEVSGATNRKQVPFSEVDAEKDALFEQYDSGEISADDYKLGMREIDERVYALLLEGGGRAPKNVEDAIGLFIVGDIERHVAISYIVGARVAQVVHVFDQYENGEIHDIELFNAVVQDSIKTCT